MRVRIQIMRLRVNFRVRLKILILQYLIKLIVLSTGKINQAALYRHSPSLHPAFRPQRFNFCFHKSFEVVFHRLRFLALQLIESQLHPHQIT